MTRPVHAGVAGVPRATPRAALSLVLLVALSLVGPHFASAADPPALVGLDALYPSLDALYLDLHRNPEISLHEERTAAEMAARLRAAGFEVTERVGGTGVVGVLANGPGPTVLVRTDLDALPMKEQTGLPWASAVSTKNDAGETVPVMHACGHDVHMTSWVGAATLLARHKALWRGTLVFVGQPAEETLQGAERMVKDGLFTRFPKPDFVVGLHVSHLIAVWHRRCPLGAGVRRLERRRHHLPRARRPRGRAAPHRRSRPDRGPDRGDPPEHRVARGRPLRRRRSSRSARSTRGRSGTSSRTRRSSS